MELPTLSHNTVIFFFFREQINQPNKLFLRFRQPEENHSIRSGCSTVHGLLTGGSGTSPYIVPARPQGNYVDVGHSRCRPPRNCIDNENDCRSNPRHDELMKREVVKFSFDSAAGNEYKLTKMCRNSSLFCSCVLTVLVNTP